MTEKQNKEDGFRLRQLGFRDNRIGDTEVQETVQPTIFMVMCKEVCVFNLIVLVVPDCFRLTDGSIGRCNIPILIHVQIP